MIKQLTLIGYYTSQIGFEQEFHGEIIPPATPLASLLKRRRQNNHGN